MLGCAQVVEFSGAAHLLWLRWGRPCCSCDLDFGVIFFIFYDHPGLNLLLLRNGCTFQALVLVPSWPLAFLTASLCPAISLEVATFLAIAALLFGLWDFCGEGFSLCIFGQLLLEFAPRVLV